MNRRRLLCCLAAAPACLLPGPRGAALAQQPNVPFVPTPHNVVDAMLKLAAVGPADYVIDLGSGDGRIVIAAAKNFGALGLGVDIDGSLVGESRREAKRQGVARRAEFEERSAFITDIGRATVLTMYLFPSMMLQLRPRLFEQLKPGTRIVSHEFDLGKWKPDERITVSVPDKPYGPPSSDVLLWIMPANAAGVWQWTLDADGTAVPCELDLQQTFQMVTGKALAGGNPARMEALGVRGDEIRLMLVAGGARREARYELRGRITGDAISGKSRRAGGPEVAWNARRTKRGSIALPAE